MQFLYPSFLFALFALAIPIIIHLFYFRRFKKVYFTNVKFLKEVKEETSARRKIRNLLVLISRLLALAFLVLAFAQPFLPQDVAVKKGLKSVSVFVDNSFSMSSLSQDVPLLEKAKTRAKEVISAYSVEDRFQVLTNDFEGRHQRLVSQEDALALVDEITVSPAVKELSNVIVRQKQALSEVGQDNKESYIISDFQKNITDLEAYQDSSLSINLLPLQSVEERNLAIDSCWFDAPVQMLNQTNQLVVKVKNYSDEDAENIRLALKMDGQVKPVGTMSIPAGKSVVDTVNITILRNGWHKAELSITDYPVQFDDSYYFSFNVAKEIKVLAINGGSNNKYLTAAFKGIASFNLTNKTTQNLEYSSFPEYHLIINNDIQNISSGLSFELTQYVKNGGNLLVFPSAQANLNTYKPFLDGFPANQIEKYEKGVREVASINVEEFIFKDVYENRGSVFKLPVSQANFKITKFASRGEEPIMNYRDGSTFIGKYKTEQGYLYLCAAPLNEDINNLVRNGEIFIPMLYKMAISNAKDEKIAFFIGKDDVLETASKETGAEMVYKLASEQEEFIPEQRNIGSKLILGLNNQIKEAGFFDFFLKEKEVLSTFAFNFDRKESDLRYNTPSDLKNMLSTNKTISIIDTAGEANFAQVVKDRSRGVNLWRWCIILALIFLALEVLLLRYWKV